MKDRLQLYLPPSALAYQRQHIEVSVQTPRPAREQPHNIGDIDKLPPVTLPDTRTPAQKAAADAKH